MHASAIFAAVQERNETDVDTLQDLETILDPSGNNPMMNRQQCVTSSTRWLRSYIPNEVIDEREVKEDTVIISRCGSSAMTLTDANEELRSQLDASKRTIDALQHSLSASEDKCAELSRNISILTDADRRKEIALRESEDVRSELLKHDEERSLREAAQSARINVLAREKKASDKELDAANTKVVELQVQLDGMKKKIAKERKAKMEADRLCALNAIAAKEAAEREELMKIQTQDLISKADASEEKIRHQQESHSALLEKYNKLKERFFVLNRTVTSPVVSPDSLDRSFDIANFNISPPTHSTPIPGAQSLHSEIIAATQVNADAENSQSPRPHKHRRSCTSETPFSERRIIFTESSREDSTDNTRQECGPISSQVSTRMTSQDPTPSSSRLEDGSGEVMCLE